MIPVVRRQVADRHLLEAAPEAAPELEPRTDDDSAYTGRPVADEVGGDRDREPRPISRPTLFLVQNTPRFALHVMKVMAERLARPRDLALPADELDAPDDRMLHVEEVR